MKFRKVILSLLTVALIGTAGMPTYAADISAEAYSSEEDGEDCASEDADIAMELYMQEEDEIPEEDEIVEGRKEYAANKSERELSTGAEDMIQDNSMALRLREIKSMNLISSKVYNIDDEFAFEVNDYKLRSASTKAASMVSTVEYSRSCRLYRKRDNATYVQWVLKGIFEYNGKTSRCKNTSMTCHNNAPGTYKVTSRTHYKSGIYAVGNCRAVNKKTGKNYSMVIRFGVKPTGQIVVSK